MGSADTSKDTPADLRQAWLSGRTENLRHVLRTFKATYWERDEWRSDQPLKPSKPSCRVAVTICGPLSVGSTKSPERMETSQDREVRQAAPETGQQRCVAVKHNGVKL